MAINQVSGPVRAGGVTAGDVKISDLSNDSLIIRLHNATNHLSRWITPVHDITKLNRSARRGDPSVRELLIALRDTELVIFPKMYLIATQNNPDLDRLSDPLNNPERAAYDRTAHPLQLLAEFRRLRQSTCSLLRSLPDTAWSRVGTSRTEHDWQIRSLAEYLADHDLDVLAEMDRVLDATGARVGISPAAGAHLDELLRLNDVSVRKQ